MASPFNPGQAPVKMASQVIETFPGDQVTENMMVEAADLFRENYRVWKQSDKAGMHQGCYDSVSSTNPEQVDLLLSPRRLRVQYLPATAATVYTRVFVDGNLAGNAFACRWKHGNQTVCWVTQLVVSKSLRKNGLASILLNALKLSTDDVFGIISSHPAACLAAAKVFGCHIEKISLRYIAQNANGIMQDSPISYIRYARLHGALFNDASDLISGVDSAFLVDHAEPQEALDIVKENWNWPLGELKEVTSSISSFKICVGRVANRKKHEPLIPYVLQTPSR